MIYWKKLHKLFKGAHDGSALAEMIFCSSNVTYTLLKSLYAKSKSEDTFIRERKDILKIMLDSLRSFQKQNLYFAIVYTVLVINNLVLHRFYTLYRACFYNPTWILSIHLEGRQ